jgi:hypothetical protein
VTSPVGEGFTVVTFEDAELADLKAWLASRGQVLLPIVTAEMGEDGEPVGMDGPDSDFFVTYIIGTPEQAATWRLPGGQ